MKCRYEVGTDVLFGFDGTISYVLRPNPDIPGSNYGQTAIFNNSVYRKVVLPRGKSFKVTTLFPRPGCDLFTYDYQTHTYKKTE